ncbi:1594_t:CDS:2 [Racocetra fulgida]|uniref:1594_t:CDS:1 n=1 Tax=Racocetra fulgida TaxID=60492 RepID=A0A9N9BW89_9GLOM|nr:1594_t:CDS:2 [Racocetra fulgida]
MPSQHKETSKKFEGVDQKPTTSFNISEIARGNETVKRTDTKPRLLFQTPKSAYESSLRTPLIHKAIISDARVDLIDFILKCCIRLQLPMTIVAAVLKYPNVPLDDCDKLKKTVKIMMSNVKNAIGRKSLNKTPIDSASRVIHTLKDEFDPNANPLFNKFVQNVWTMIINCLYSTRIAMTYSSDELATAVIYITSGNVGIDLKRDFDVFCAESSSSDPSRIKAVLS